MKTKFNLKLLSAAVVLSIPFVAEASLGKLQLHSHLNQPFSGTVVVDGNDAQTIINTPNVISISGNQYIHASPYRKGDKVVVSLTSTNVVNDPVVSFSLRVGNSIRYYSTLIDPQQAVQPQQADVNSSSSATPNIIVGTPSIPHGTVVPPVATSGTVKQQPTSTNPQRVVPQDGTHTAEGNVVPGKIYVTHPGDTIIAIARSVQPSNLTLSQTMKAIISANRNIFRGGNTNLLYVGARVRIPTYAEMTKLASGVAPSERSQSSKSNIEKVVEPTPVKPLKQKAVAPAVKPIEVPPVETKKADELEAKPKHEEEKAQKIEPMASENTVSAKVEETKSIEPVQDTEANNQANNTQTAPVPSTNVEPQGINNQDSEQSGDMISNVMNLVSSFWQYILGGIAVLVLLILGLLFARRKKDKVDSNDDGIAIHHAIPPASEPPVLKPAPVPPPAPVAPQVSPTSAGVVATSFDEPEPIIEEPAISESDNNILGGSLDLGEDSWDDSLSLDDTPPLDSISTHSDELDDNTFSDLMDVDLGGDDFNQELPTHNSFQESEGAVENSSVHTDLADLELPSGEDFSTDFSTDFDVSTEKTEVPAPEFNINQQEKEVATPLFEKEDFLPADTSEPVQETSLDISENDLNVAFEDVAVSRRKSSIEDQLATGQEQLDYNPSLDFNLDDFDSEPEPTVSHAPEPAVESSPVVEPVVDNSSALEWDFSPTPAEEKTVAVESTPPEESAFVAKDMPSMDFGTNESVATSSDDDGISLDFNVPESSPQVESVQHELEPATADQGFNLSELDSLGTDDVVSQSVDHTVTNTSDSLDFNVAETGFDFKPEETETSTVESSVDENTLDFSSFNTASESSYTPEESVETNSVLDDSHFLDMGEATHQEPVQHDTSLELDTLEADKITFTDTTSQEEPVLSSEDSFDVVNQQSDSSMQEDFSVPLYAKLELAKMYLEANDHDGAEEVLMELAEESENTNPTVYAKVQELMAELNN